MKVKHHGGSERFGNGRPDRTLKTALSSDEASHVLQHGTKCRDDHRKAALEWCAGRIPLVTSDPNHVTHRCLRKLIAKEADLDQRNPHRARQYTGRAKLIERIVEGNLIANYPSKDKRQKDLRAWRKNRSGVIRKCIEDPGEQARWREAQVARHLVTEAHRGPTMMKIELGDGVVNLFGSLIGFECEHGVCLDSYSQLLCATDAVMGRHSATLYASVIDALKIRDTGEYQSETLKVMSYVDDELDACGQRGFELIKAIPELVIASWIKQEGEGAVVDSKLYKSSKGLISTVLEKDDKDRKRSMKDSPLYKWATRRFTDGASFRRSHEIAELLKLAGHPTVDTIKTAVSFYTAAKRVLKIDQGAVEEVTWQVRKLLCKSYFTKHNRWPLIEMTEKVAPEIQRLVAKNAWCNHTLKAKHFENVKFKQNDSLDRLPNILDLLDDKAIIEGFEHWPEEYEWEAHRRMYDNQPLQRVTNEKGFKRVLLAYMAQEKLELKDLLEDVQKNGLSHSDRIMVLCAKEREMSETGRLFCKMSFKARIVQVAMEHLIGDAIMPLLNQSAMAKSEAQLLMTLSAMSKEVPLDSKYLRLFLHFDFKKWCWSQVGKVNEGVAKILDEWFGTESLFTRFVWFDDWEVFIQSRFFPPKQDEVTKEPQEGLSYHRGSQIWCEGMAQKRWTLITLALIGLACEELGATYLLQGQGDNQTLTLFVPPEDDVKRGNLTADEYLCRVKDLVTAKGEKIGLFVKPLETWWSRTLMIFGKRLRMNGATVESGLKAISRSHAMSGDDIASLSNDIATASAGGVAAAGCDRDPLAAFVVSLVEVLDTLDLYWGEDWHSLDLDQKSSALAFTRVLGGLPLCQMSDMIVRGTQDPLVQTMFQLRAYWDNFPSMRPYIQAMIPEMHEKKDLTLMLIDVFSLPINGPDTIEVEVSRRVRDELREKAVNLELRASMDALSEGGLRESLVDDLTIKMNPFIPAVSSAIFVSSRLYQFTQYLAKYEKASTLKSLLPREVKHELARIATDLGGIFKKYYLSKLKKAKWVSVRFDQIFGVGIDDERELTCTTLLAKVYRSISWGFVVRGLETPCVADQGILIKAKDVLPHEISRAIEVKHDGASNNHSAVGAFDPYYGSATNLKAKRGSIEIEESSRDIRSINSLITTYRWTFVQEGEHMKDLLGVLISEHTSLNQDIFMMAADEVYSGSAQHRLTPQGTPRGSMVNSIGNMASHLRYSTDGATMMARGGADRTVFFQLVFNTITGNIEPYLEEGETEYYFVLNCDGCLTEVESEKVDMVEAPSYTGLDLGQRVAEVHIKKDMIQHDTSVPLEYSLAAHAGIKLAAKVDSGDIIHGQDYGHVIADGGASVIGYTELCRCNIGTLLDYLNGYSRVMRDLGQNRMINEIPQPYHLIPGVAPTLLHFCNEVISCQRVGELMAAVHEYPALHSTSTTAQGVMQLLMFACSKRSLSPPKSLHVVPGASDFVILRVWKCNTYAVYKKEKWLWKSYRERFDIAKLALEAGKTLPEVEDSLPQVTRPKFLESEGALLSRCRQEPPVDSRVPLENEYRVPDRPSTATCIMIPVQLTGVQCFPEVPERPADEGVRVGHCGRVIGRESTSASKFIEMLSNMNLRVDSGVAICLAEGSGSIACAIAHLNSTIRVLYNDLVADTPSSLPMYRPPCFATDLCQLTDIRTQEMVTGYRDLTEEGTILKIERIVSEESEYVSVVTMDAEMKEGFTEYEELLRNTARVWVLAGESALGVFKVFLAEIAVNVFIDAISQLSSKVTLVKPSCSDRSSAELYVVAIRNRETSFEWRGRTDEGVEIAIKKYDLARRQLIALTLAGYGTILLRSRQLQFKFFQGDCLDMRRYSLMRLGLSSATEVNLRVRLEKALAAKGAAFDELLIERVSAHQSLSLQNSIIKGERQTSAFLLLREYCTLWMICKFANTTFEKAVHLCQVFRNSHTPCAYMVALRRDKPVPGEEESVEKGDTLEKVYLRPVVRIPPGQQVLSEGPTHAEISTEAWKIFGHLFGPILTKPKKIQLYFGDKDFKEADELPVVDIADD